MEIVQTGIGQKALERGFPENNLTYLSMLQKPKQNQKKQTYRLDGKDSNI